MNTLELSQQLYAAFAKADLAAVFALLSDEIEWTLIGPRSIPYFGSYHGRAQVQEFFSTLFAHEELLEFRPQQFIDGGASVVVLGYERCRSRATQREYQAQWAHVFESSGGLITRWREYIDTAPIVSAYASAKE